MSVYFQLLLASFFWGSNVVVMKILLDDISFLMLALMRVFFSLLFLSCYLYFMKIPLTCSTKHQTAIIAFLSIYLNFFLTFLGMNEVKGIDNAFMNALAPSVTFLLLAIFLKQKGSFLEYVAIACSTLAFLLSIHFRIFSIQIGFFYLLLGMILYISGNILVQKWHMQNGIVLTFYELLWGCLFLAIHCLITQRFSLTELLSLTVFDWLLFLIISGIGFAFIQVTYIKSVEKIGAFQTSFFLSMNPLFTYMGSLLFLHEDFDWLHCLGFVLLIGSVVMMKKRKHHEFPSK